MSSPSKPKAAPQDPTLTDMRKFHATLDMAELWEEFYTAWLPNGQPQFKSIFSFVRERVPRLYQNDKQRKFLQYYLGPAGAEDALDDFKFVKPLDWDYRRDTGGWASDAAGAALKKSITAHWNRLDALREIGNGYVLHDIFRLKKIMEVIDRAYNFGQASANMSREDINRHLEQYLTMVAKVQKLSGKAIDTLAKTYGINFDETEGLTAILMGNLQVQSTDQATDGKKKVVNSFAEMLLTKSLKFNTPLPPGSDKIIEGHVEPADTEKKKIN